MERVAAVELGGESVAYPFLRLEETPVVNDDIGGTPVVVFFSPGTTSALDGSDIAASRDVGATGVYDRRLGDQTLTFRPDSGAFIDEETGSTWNVLGRAVDGPLDRRDPDPHNPRQPLLVRLGRLQTRPPESGPPNPLRHSGPRAGNPRAGNSVRPERSRRVARTEWVVSPPPQTTLVTPVVPA